MDSLEYLSGQATLPRTPRPLTKAAEFDSLFSLLYKEDKSLQPFIVQKKFDESAQNLVYGADYLRALRASPQGLDNLAYLTGKKLSASGALKEPEIETLMSLLYLNEKDLHDFVKKNDFTQAVENLQHGSDYLKALRTTPRGLEAFSYLDG